MTPASCRVSFFLEKKLIGIFLYNVKSCLIRFLMCLSPIRIKNPSRYISLEKRDSLFIDVPCGKCPECRSLYSLQWYHRAIVEFQHCISNGGYALFDTLTYAPEYLPKVSDLFEVPLDFPCFSRDDVTRFLKRLRKRLKTRYNYDGLRYYLVSEYGTDPNKSHRPHYHVLFFCDSVVPPLELSRLIHDSWKLGRTDGLPCKSASYVLNNRVYDKSIDRANFAVIEYVSKYVNKSCQFESEIKKRVDLIVGSKTQDWSDKQKKSVHFKVLYRSVYNQLKQFHRQSVGFGSQVLDEVDLIELVSNLGFKCNILNKIVCIVPLSTYFKRKLFYDLVEYNGCKSWQLNDLGLDFVPLFERSKLECFKKKFIAVDDANHNVLSAKLSSYGVTLDDFAKYALELRGHVREFMPVYRLEDKVDDFKLFHYGCECDELHFGFRFYSYCFCGVKDNYLFPKDIVKFDDILEKYCIQDKKLDSILDEFYKLSGVNSHVDGVNDLMKLKERLVNIYKRFGLQSAL